MRNRLGKMKQMLAMGLAVSIAAQTFLAMPATAAEAVEAVEEIMTEPAPPEEAAEEVRIEPDEEIVPAEAMDAVTLTLYLNETVTEQGLTWKNNTLTLQNYQGGKNLNIKAHTSGETVSEIKVTVKGNNNVGYICAASNRHLIVSGDNRTTDTLRILSDNSSDMLENATGSITIRNLTLDMRKTGSWGGGIVISKAEENAFVKVENSNVSIQTAITGNSAGTGGITLRSTDRRFPVIMNNTTFTFDGEPNPIWCSDLTITNSVIETKGSHSISVFNDMTADKLTLKAESSVENTALWVQWNANITNSAIFANCNMLLKTTKLSMTNTTVNATAYAYLPKGKTENEEAVCIRADEAKLQGCSLTLKTAYADNAADTTFWYNSAMVIRDALELTDTTLNIRTETTERHDNAIETNTMTCRGNTKVTITTTPYKVNNTGEWASLYDETTGSVTTIFLTGEEGSLNLHDNLAILTPEGGAVGKHPYIDPGNTILDARGRIVGNLEIGKSSGASSGSGNAPGGGTGTGTGTSTGTSGSGGTVSSGSGSASGGGGASGGGSSSGSTSAAGTWKKAKNGKYWYDLGKGKYPKSKWLQIGGKWYYFDKSGYMVTGWKKVSGKWYYLNKKTGAMKTGWLESGGKWYYMDKKSGAMQTGWKKVSGKWYYLDKKSGAMKTGWLKSGGKWYYLNGKGVMLANTSRKIGRKTYRFDKNGVCTNA